MTSVCDVGGLDCDHVVQQKKRKSARDRIGRCFGYLLAGADLNRSILVILGMYKCGVLHFRVTQRLACRVY